MALGLDGPLEPEQGGEGGKKHALYRFFDRPHRTLYRPKELGGPLAMSEVSGFWCVCKRVDPQNIYCIPILYPDTV